MTTNDKLAALRAAMKENGMNAYVIPSSDPHMSEYLPEHWKVRAYLSGFDGSAGTLVVTEHSSALWTDGRYFIRADRQLAGSEIALMRMGVKDTPTVGAFLRDALPEKGHIGLEYMTAGTAFVQEILKDVKIKGVEMGDMPLPGNIWPDRPHVPTSEIWEMAAENAGASAAEKLKALQAKLKEQHCDAMVVCRLDDIAWLLNLRATDIAYNPFFLAYVLVTEGQSTLYTNLTRLPQAVQASLEKQGISTQNYEGIISDIRALEKEHTFLFDREGSNYALYMALGQNGFLKMNEGDDPLQLMKSIKSDVEIRNTIEAHAKDGVAMVRFQMDLEKAMAAGKTLTELDIAAMVRARRSEQEGFLEESFGSIPAYGPNAAMMHYTAKEGSAATLEKKGFLLLDSGGQYRDGTTDITRTYALGTPTAEEKDYYTLVLRSHIDMALAVFLEGSSGGNIDILARAPFWKRGLDYRCGTGHGVGHVGGVHEGPQSLRQPNRVPFQVGMVITDEPGIYEEGKIGIRIENELLCREKSVTEYGRFLGFETMTFCPIDLTAVDTDALTDEELDWLNDYHQKVYDKLVPRLEDDERAWLAKKCVAVGK